MPKTKIVIIMAGETSGDMHGAKLVKAMLAKNPKLTFYGMGGEALQSAGVKKIIDASQISIVGIAEIFSKIFQMLRSGDGSKYSFALLLLHNPLCFRNLTTTQQTVEINTTSQIIHRYCNNARIAAD